MPIYMGMISGTSMDAIDAALVELDDGPPKLIRARASEIPDGVRRSLFEVVADPAPDLEKVSILDVQLGHAFGAAALSLLEEAGIEPSRIRAIGSHGQTIRHQPNGTYPFSVQIGDPNIIAEETGITTVADFRRRDMAAGGEGAPLVPPFHHSAFNRKDRGQVVLNLGGIANITALPPGDDPVVVGFDSGPGNALLDEWVTRHRGEAMDVDGGWAEGGEVERDLLTALRGDPYFSRPAPKSTGRDHFNLTWLEGCLAAVGGRMRPESVQRTLLELTASSVADAIGGVDYDVSEVLVCGGGARNPLLMRRLSTLVHPTTVRSTEAYALPPDWIEAMAFAWLARQTLEGRPGNIPTVTGARRPVVLGGVFVGRGGLALEKTAP